MIKKRKPKANNTRKRIVDELRISIKAGEYSPGSKLPTVRELGRHYQTSHANAAVAVNILTEEGLLVKRQGSGVYVPNLFDIEPNSLRIYATYAFGRKTQEVIEDFKKANPDIKLYGNMPFDEADVCVLGASGIQENARKGGLIPLNEFMARADLSPEQFHSGALSVGSLGDDVFALPMVFSPNLLLFNRNHVKESRERLSQWTLDDMFDYVKSVSPTLKKEQIHPYVYSLCFSTQVYPYLPMFGAELVDESGRYCQIDQVESLNTFQYFLDLINATPWRNLSHKELVGAFYRNEAALYNAAGLLNEKIQRDHLDFIDIVPMPTGQYHDRHIVGIWFGIHSQCHDPKLAWRFIRHVVSHKAQRCLADAQILFPSRLDGIEHLRALDDYRYSPLIERLFSERYVTPAVNYADLLFLNRALEEWYMVNNLLDYLRIAGRKVEQRLRHANPGIDETPGL